MLSFLKANIASVIASLCDYGITMLAVQVLKMDAVPAGITGTVAGGIINFALGRHWVFDAAHISPRRQAKRYLLVWTGSLLLNAAGMYICTKPVGMYYMTAKIVSSVTVALAWNFPLQKRYVFKRN
jgi:putative flippase GtrA